MMQCMMRFVLFFALLIQALADPPNEQLSIDPDMFVLWHNAYRCMHNSPPVVWDPALAKSAQKWANTCTGSHSSDLSNAGENIWGDSLYLGTAQEVVGMWYNEINDPGYKFEGYQPTAAHFTQVIWAASTKIGCAACRNGGTSWRYVVCQYSPAGNAPGFSANVARPTKTAQACFPTPSPPSCINYPLDWKDLYGHTCDQYVSNHWCENGKTGSGWPKNAPSIAEFYDSRSLSAFSVCCACGGGVDPSPLPGRPKAPQLPFIPNAVPNATVPQTRSRSPSPSPSARAQQETQIVPADVPISKGAALVPGSVSVTATATGTATSTTSPTSTAWQTGTASSTATSTTTGLQTSTNTAILTSVMIANNEPSEGSCTNYPYAWVDYLGYSCDTYEAYRWCENGDEGSGWPWKGYFSIAALRDRRGRSAFQTCCVCGGGIHSSDSKDASANPEVEVQTSSPNLIWMWALIAIPVCALVAALGFYMWHHKHQQSHLCSIDPQTMEHPPALDGPLHPGQVSPMVMPVPVHFHPVTPQSVSYEIV